jgi:hypothetical protein
MEQKILMTPQDMGILAKIIEENDLKYAFALIYNGGSGIGYTLDVEFEKDINGREATVRIPITGVENW